MADPAEQLQSPLRLRLDGAALADNWRALAGLSRSAACGAAVKADGYGLGARGVVERLVKAGCRDFFVATWAEALEIADLAPSVAVLHGVREADMAVALAAPGHLRPVLCTAEQVARWKAAEGGRFDAMVDTGMNRLGLSVTEAGGGLLDGMTAETLLSHLACADEDHPLNAEQLARFAPLTGLELAKRYSLTNSAGIFLGEDYHFDLTRPGLALYGGLPTAAAQARIKQVVRPEAEVLQRRCILTGESVGYNATFTAQHDMELAVLNIGYADGYLRGFSNAGAVWVGDRRLPVVGRVSMDLLIVDCSTAPDVAEGDWLTIDYRLPDAAAQSGLSQYELLTGLGARFERVWI